MYWIVSPSIWLFDSATICFSAEIAVESPPKFQKVKMGEVENEKAGQGLKD